MLNKKLLLYFAFLCLISVQKAYSLGLDGSFINQHDDNPLIIEAVKIDGIIQIDGFINEPEWEKAPVVSSFRQVEPNQGELAIYQTEVRILYNNDFIYIAARMYDDPGARPRVSSMTRNFAYFENDLFGVVFDPFNTERDAISFQVTPFGNQRDLQVFDDAIFNRDFDFVWHAQTQILHDGWVVEMAIPWSSVRYPEENDTWGINFIRIHRRSNEESAWAAWPRAFTGYRTAYAGKITGLQPPHPSLNLRVQPYMLIQGDRSYSNNNPDVSLKPGGEIKWAPTKSSVVDITFNTDFAQVEVDDQVINLTRIPFIFPEKRQFFLENANLFNVGRVNWLKPFFSRRIGLTEMGEPAPIDAGFRFTDQNTERSYGALIMRQREMGQNPAAWFGVGRYLKNFGQDKRAGILLTGRHDNQMDGVAANKNVTANTNLFMRFSSGITLDANISGTYDQNDSRWGNAGDLLFFYLNSFIYVGLMQAFVSPEYNPGVGLVGRRDVIMTSPAATLNWRPAWRPKAIRAFTPSILTFFYHSYSGLAPEQNYISLSPVSIEFNNGSNIKFSWIYEWHNLQTPFMPAGIILKPGEYDFQQYELQFRTDQSANLGLEGSVKRGGYFDGELTQFSLGSTVRPIPNIAFEGNFTRNLFSNLGPDALNKRVDLLITRMRLSFNPRIHLIGLWQHNTNNKTNSINIRFNWEFRPLSHIYLVFYDFQPFGDDIALRPPGQQQAVFKITYLYQI